MAGELLRKLQEGSVYDGDTVTMSDGDSTRGARIIGYDTPELDRNDPGAQTGKRLLQKIMQDPTLEAESQGTDRYGRELVELEREGRPVAEEMLHSGAAVPFAREASTSDHMLSENSIHRRAFPQFQSETDKELIEELRTNRIRPGLPSIDFPEPKNRSERAWNRGVANLKHSLGSAGNYLGEQFGIDTLTEEGQDLMSRSAIDAFLNSPDVPSFMDVDSLADAGAYAQEKIIENIPNLALMAGGGGMGAAARIGFGLARAQGAKAIASGLHKYATAGGAASVYPLHLGEHAEVLRDTGVDLSESKSPFLLAGLSSALDAGGMDLLLRSAFKGLSATAARDVVKESAKLADKKGMLSGVMKHLGRVTKEGAKGASAGAGIESVTEGLQEFVLASARAYHDPDYDLFSEETALQVAEGAIAGGTVGGALGGTARGAAASVTFPGEPESDIDAPTDESSDIESPVLETGPETPPGSEFDAAPEGPIDNDRTVPETDATIDAQAQAVESPDSSRDSVLLTQERIDTLSPSRRQDLNQKVREGTLEKVNLGAAGVVLTNNIEKASRLRQARSENQVTEELINEVLFNDAGSPTKEGDAVVTSRDEQGTPVADITVDSSNPQQVESAVAEAEAQGETAEIREPQSALMERLTEAEKERSVQPEVAQLGEMVEADESGMLRTALGKLRNTAADADPNLTEDEQLTLEGAYGVMFGDVENTTPEGVIKDMRDLVSRPAENETDSNVYLNPEEVTEYLMAPQSERGTEDQRRQLKAQAGTLAGVLEYTSEDGTQQATDSVSISEDKSGNTLIQFQQLDKTQRDPDASPAFVRELTNAFTQGITDGKSANRVTFRTRDDVNPKGDGTPREVRVNAPALTRAGAQLIGLDSSIEAASAKDQRAAFNAGVAWLDQHGLELATPEEQYEKTVIVPGRGGNRQVKAKAGKRPKTESLKGQDREFAEIKDILRQKRDGLSQETETEEAGVVERNPPAFEQQDFARFDEATGESVDESQETESDERQLETEETQNRRSTRGAYQRRGTSRKAPGAKPPKATISAHGSSVTGRWASAAKVALAKVGMDNVELRLADKAGISDLRAEFGTGTQGSPRENKARASNEAVLNDLESSGALGRIVFLKNPASPNEAIPAIYVNSRLPKYRQTEILGHEMGHLVFERTAQEGGTQLRDALVEEFGPDPVEAHERFANFFAAFVLADYKTAQAMVSDSNKGVLTRFARRLKAQLRDLWQALVGEQGAQTAQRRAASFKDFVEQWTGYSQNDAAPEPTTKLGKMVAETFPREKQFLSPVLRDGTLPAQYMNFDEEPRAAQKKRIHTRMADAVKSAKKGVSHVWDSTLGSTAAILRRRGIKYGDHMLADEFDQESGREKSAGAPEITVRHEIETEMAQFNEQLREVTKQGPGMFSPLQWFPGQKRKEPSDSYKQAQAVVTGRESADNLKGEAKRLHGQVRSLLDGLHKWMNDHHVRVGFAKDYFPFVINRHKLAQNREAAIKKMSDWARTRNGQLWLKDNGFKTDDAAINAWANTYYEAFLETDSALSQLDDDSFEFLSPGFTAGKKRRMHNELIQELAEYREDDIVSIMQEYIKSGVRRGVWQNRFGQNEAVGRINDAWQRVADKQMPSSEATKLQKKLEDAHEQKWGISVYDPVARLKNDLKQQYMDGDLTRADYEYVTNIAIPSAQGRLGAEMNPTYRKFQGAAMIYQNVRVLSTAVFAQMVDPALTVSHARGLSGKANAIKTVIKGMTNKEYRHQLFDTARIMGTINDGIVQHILNDEHAHMLASPRLREFNEWFFRANGMQFVTNFGRAVATTTALEQIKTYVREGQDRYLKLLGIDPAAAKAWVAAGAPTTPSSEHASVLNGIHQFVDESIMAPDPMTRGVVGNDQRFALIWHLHGFAWQYHNRVLMRAINEGIDTWGREEGLKKVAAAMPAIAIASMIIPVAAASREIRWLLLDNKDPRVQSGWDHAWEAIRWSGILGIGEELAQIHENYEYDRNILLTALGPTVGQIDAFFEKDLNTWTWKALPAYPLTGRMAEILDLR